MEVVSPEKPFENATAVENAAICDDVAAICDDVEDMDVDQSFAVNKTVYKAWSHSVY